MNIRAKLAFEHSKTTISAIARYVGDDAQRLKMLTDIFFGDDVVLRQRAAWAFSEVVCAHPQMLKPYWKKIMPLLADDSQHNAVARNILRMLQEADLNENYESQLLDLCMHFIRSERYAIAVRAFAITVAARICIRYPELSRELKLLLDEIRSQPHAPALQVRIKRAMKDISSAAAS